MAGFYEPIDVEEPAKATPGEYAFKVDDAGEVLFKPNKDGVRNKGVKLILLVDVGDRDVKVFFNLVLSPKAMWRVREFMLSLGLDYKNPGPIEDLIGRLGRASFVVGERGYLEVDRFIEAPALAGAGAKQPAKAPPANDDDKVPF